MIEMVELFAVARFGEQAAFSGTERFLIEEPLADLIERYGGAAEQYSALIHPVMVILGVGLYTVRLAALAKVAVENEAKKTTAPPKAQPAPNRTNGVEHAAPQTAIPLDGAGQPFKPIDVDINGLFRGPIE